MGVDAILGDLTLQPADALVNAANSSMLGGGGVDGALHAARWVIHTVGPNRNAGQTDESLLAACYTTALDVAAGLGARTVAFPAIGAGVYGWDAATAARVAVDTVLAHPRTGIERVRFVLFSPRLLQSFTAALDAAGAT